VDLIVTILQFAVWPLCLTMVGLILLQGGSGDVSSAFGGGGQLDTTLGVGASRKMAKLTGVLAVTFFLVVIILAIPRTKSFALPPGPAAKPAEAPATPPAPASMGPAQPAIAPAPTAIETVAATVAQAVAAATQTIEAAIPAAPILAPAVPAVPAPEAASAGAQP
jgi:protein translocase SecG subunit